MNDDPKALFVVQQFLDPSKLTPGVRYNLTAYVQGNDVSSNNFWETKGLMMTVLYSDGEGVILTVDGSNGNQTNLVEIDVGEGTTANRKMTVSFVYTPKQGKTIEWIELRTGLQYATGTFWMDNVSLKKAEGGEELILDGGFDNLWFPPIPYTETITPSDIDSFVTFATAVGAEPLITLNAGAFPWDDSRDVANRQRQADLVSYANVEKNYDIKYWQIGNEPEGWRWRWKEWLDIIASNDVQGYAARYGEYYSAIKAISPGILGFSPGFLFDGFATELMNTQGPKVDVLDVHHYRSVTQPEPLNEAINQLLSYDGDAYGELQGYSNDLSGFDARLNKLKSLTSDYNSNTQLSISEYGACGGSCPAINGVFADALWTANMLGIMANYDAEFSTRWWLLGDIGGVISGNYTPRAPYYSFFLFANHFGTKVLDVTASFSPNILDVYVFSSKSDDGNKVYLMIVNRAPTNETFSVNLDGFTKPNLKGDAYVLTSPHLNRTIGANINGIQINPDDVTGSISAIQPVTFDITGQSFTYTSLAYSVTAIEVYQKADCDDCQNSDVFLKMNLDNNLSMGETPTKAVDQSPYGNNGTFYNNTVWTTEGRISGAVKFDGYGDYIQTAANNALDSANAGTVTAWIKTSSSATQTIAAYATSSSLSSNYVWRIRNNVLDMAWNFADSGGNWNYINGTTSVNDGNWHFVAFVSDGLSRNKIYLDGVEQATTFASTSGSTDDKGWTGDINLVGNYNHHINIGGLNRGTSPTNWFNGTIDHVRIWKKTLSHEEIIQQMTEGGSAADLNGDGKVDISDLVIVAADFGKKGRFDARADTDDNGEIDIFDIVFVSSRFD
ncbi:MAG: LamG-like jellyroll fold domain-containing protein [Candidatus Aenigmatarchaeota archaeon]